MIGPIWARQDRGSWFFLAVYGCERDKDNRFASHFLQDPLYTVILLLSGLQFVFILAV